MAALRGGGRFPESGNSRLREAGSRTFRPEEAVPHSPRVCSDDARF